MIIDLEVLSTLSTERFGNLNFVLATDEEGTFYAYRENSPYFCFEGNTVDDVLDKVSGAINLYTGV